MKKFSKFGKLEAIFMKENGVMMSRTEWLAHRQLGLGGSDMGTIMDMNPRFSPVELFYQKLGLNYTGETEDNIYMFWGRLLEDPVLDVAQYFDHALQEYMDNYTQGVKLRKITHLPLMVRNPEYPWLIANIDGLEGWNKSYKYPKADALAEAKTISKQAREKWEGLIPPYYIAQSLMYGTVLKEILRGHVRVNIYVLQDGRDYSSIPLDMDIDQRLINIQQSMLAKSYEFWEKIKIGKKIVTQYEGYQEDETMRLELMQALSELEPQVDPNPAYQQFYSKFYVDKMEMLTRVIDGDPDTWEKGMQYLKASKDHKETEAAKMHLANEIREILKNKNAYQIDFKGQGKISFNKRLYVNLKP
jgi:putative phage-type endonuclease